MVKTFLWLALAALQQPPATDPWEKEIAAFEARDKENPPPKDTLHLNDNGYAILSEVVGPVLRQKP